MQEAIKRRFRDFKGKTITNILLLIDGGQNQVNAIQEILDEYKITIEIVGMVKNDKHRTDHLYYLGNEIDISKEKDLLHIITQIQDETHRFAITYHDSLRNKEMKKSILDNIQGIGPKKKLEIMKELQDINKLKDMSIDEICKINKIDKKTAENIYNYFNKK